MRSEERFQVAWRVWLQQNADRVIEIPEPFNWSRFNNIAAAATDSEYLLFLNDDVEITQDDWLDALLEHAQRPEVGLQITSSPHTRGWSDGGSEGR